MKKIFSWFLIIAMCIGMLPVSAFSNDNAGTESDIQEIAAVSQNESTEKVTFTDASEAAFAYAGEVVFADAGLDKLCANIEMDVDSDMTAAPVESDISTGETPDCTGFNLEDAYAYYITMDSIEDELYLASLSEEERFMLLDYIDAMNELSLLEAEAASELAQAEEEMLAELAAAEAELQSDSVVTETEQDTELYEVNMELQEGDDIESAYIDNNADNSPKNNETAVTDDSEKEEKSEQAYEETDTMFSETTGTDEVTEEGENDTAAFSDPTLNDIFWSGGDVIEATTIVGGSAEDPVVITVNGTVTVIGTITLSGGYIEIKGAGTETPTISLPVQNNSSSGFALFAVGQSENASLRISNLKLYDEAECNRAILIGNLVTHADIDINDVTIDSFYYGIQCSSPYSTVDLNNVTIENCTYGLQSNQATVTAENCSFSKNGTGISNGSYDTDLGNVTLIGSTVTENTIGVSTNPYQTEPQIVIGAGSRIENNTAGTDCPLRVSGNVYIEDMDLNGYSVAVVDHVTGTIKVHDAAPSQLVVAKSADDSLTLTESDAAAFVYVPSEAEQMEKQIYSQPYLVTDETSTDHGKIMVCVSYKAYIKMTGTEGEDGFFISPAVWSGTTYLIDPSYQIKNDTDGYYCELRDETEVIFRLDVRSGFVIAPALLSVTKNGENIEMTELSAVPSDAAANVTKSYVFTVSISEQSEITINGISAPAKISTYSLTIGSDLSMNFFITLTDSLTLNDVYLECTRNGNITKVYGNKVDNKNRFQYNGINPQCMTDPVKVDLKLCVDGAEDITLQSVTRSVTDYCNKVYETSANESLKELVAYMLKYGTEAQKSMAYRTDDYALERAEWASTYLKTVADPGDYTKEYGTGEDNEGKSRFVSANMTLSTLNYMNFFFTIDEGENAEDYTVEIKKGDTDIATYAVKDLTLTNGRYKASSNPLKATYNNDAYTASIYKNGELQVYYKFSANYYLHYMRNTESNMKDLIVALFEYGCKAKTYADQS